MSYSNAKKKLTFFDKTDLYNLSTFFKKKMMIFQEPTIELIIEMFDLQK